MSREVLVILFAAVTVSNAFREFQKLLSDVSVQIVRERIRQFEHADKLLHISQVTQSTGTRHARSKFQFDEGR